MRLILSLAISLFSFFSVYSQTFNAKPSLVKGKVVDTLQKRNLEFAVVSLLRKSDSVLFTFTRTNGNGEFQLENVTPGKYSILVTSRKFADFAEDIDVKDQPVNDLGVVPLTLKSSLLEAVIIKNTGAIRIKGDTTEFVADSFKVKEGATVEDLLKKLPGFQVNSKGEITAQGQRVQKVLVDGEEFFGDDPTMATQNISARAVDKVQVFDTKTEQQQLTGISSGNDGKTVNIKLKDDHKKGGFGKLTAGSDFKDFVDAKALFNQFVGKRKIATYATKSNINTGSLSWQDREKLGIENDFEYDEIGGYYFSFGSDDGFNDWNLKGLPDSYTAGALFNNKWNEDKQGLNTSYRFNRLRTTNTGSTFSQFIRPHTIDYRNIFTNSNNLSQQHALNGKYEWKLDSLTSFKFTTAGSRRTTDVISQTYSEYLNESSELENTSDQTRNNYSTKLQSDNQLVYKQLFKKPNRQLITTLRFGLIEDEQDGHINTNASFYQNNVVDSTALIDQLKIFDGNSRTIGGKITYVEPLAAKWNLVVDYSHNLNRSSSYRNTFNKSPNGKYEDLDLAFSNNFDLDAFSNNGTALLRYVDQKLRFVFGSGVSETKLNLNDINKGTKSKFEFFRITPQAQVNYTLKPQTNISFNYRGSTRQPTINQLQPIRDNSDPLYVFEGNPDLDVGFNHSFSTSFNQYKVLSRRGIWVNINYNITNNAIVNSTAFDDATRKITYSPVNVDGVHNWNVWSNWNKGGGEKKLNYGARINGNGGRNINLVDGQKNITNYATMRLGLSLGLDNPDKHSFWIRPELSYNRSSSSLQKSVNNNYYTYGGWADGFVMLPGKLELRSEWNFDLRQKINAFSDNTNIVLWNASIARTVFKNKSGKIFLTGNDLLDQNKGFNRNISSSTITEERFSRISRYFLLKFEWSFNKMAGSK